MGVKSILKNTSKYIFKKISKTAVGRGARWAFWSLLFLYPATAVTTVGVSGIMAGAAFAHSGIIEYSAGKVIDKAIKTE